MSELRANDASVSEATPKKDVLDWDWNPRTTIPHPDAEWRDRGLLVLHRMEEHGLHSAAWQHSEIWSWAASTSAGRDWLEREILYWENRMSERDRLQLKMRRRKPILKPGDLAEYVDEVFDLFTDELRAREKLEAGYGRHRRAW